MTTKTGDSPYNVYRVTCVVTNKAYIGITRRSVGTRWSAHCSLAKRRPNVQTALGKAIRKYGRDNFTVETLTTACDAREATAVERGLIAQYGTLSPRGYNLTSGGEMGFGSAPTIEVRQRMSVARKKWKQAPISEETRQRMRVARIAVMTPELRAKIGAAHKGKFMSPEVRAKISASKKGKSPSHYPKNRKSHVSV